MQVKGVYNNFRIKMFYQYFISKEIGLKKFLDYLISWCLNKKSKVIYRNLLFNDDLDFVRDDKLPFDDDILKKLMEVIK